MKKEPNRKRSSSMQRRGTEKKHFLENESGL